MESKDKITNKLTNLLFLLSILIFTVGLNFQDNPPSGWYQQWLPDLNGMPLSDIYFIDSLTGWAVTGNSQPNDTSGYIVKTTNGGDNWTIKFLDFRDFSRVRFINPNTGFVSGGYATGARIYKSTNGGDNWFTINTPGGGQIYFDDMSVLNEDTLWVVAHNSLIGGVFRTTNGGTSWQQQLSLGSQNPTNIYFYNKDIGYAANNILYKTTNSGINWFQIPGGGFSDMYFINNSTGWKCTGSNMRKTTDGGLNWQLLPLPPEVGTIVLSRVIRFDNINADTIWGVGSVGVVSTGLRGLIYLTTNGGNIWGYQLPDTSINIFQYYYIHFTDTLHGWAYNVNRGVHTITGGDTTIYLGVNQISSEIPKDYKLYQNYPNPFNPATEIIFEIKKTSDIKLIVFDINGREIETLIDKRLSPGSYKYKFNGGTLSSGIYFYSLIAEGKIVDTKKMILLK